MHRIGRTGRAGNTGNAWSFVNDKASHLFKDLFEMLHENKQVVPQWLTTIIESSGGRAGGMQRGGHGGNRRFGAKDYRQGGQGYGQHKGGRGGMAHGGMAKRFQHGQQQGHGHGQQQAQGMFAGGQQQPQQGGGMFSAGGGGGGAMRPNNPGASFNLAAAMTGRPFPQQQQGGQVFNH